MRVSSAKAKGRRAATEVADLLRKYAPWIAPDDIHVTSSSVGGRDITMSDSASKTYPFAIEVKCVELLNVWQAYAQSEGHVKKLGEVPILFFKRNRSELMVCLKAEDFMQLMEKKR